MSAFRLLERPLVPAIALALLASVGAAAQATSSVQKLLERGALEEAVQRADAERDNPESLYFAAQAATKLNNSGRAVEQYTRLQETSDEAWKAIGESGLRLMEGNAGEAMAAAERAIAANGDNAFAHYQLAVAATRKNDFTRAADAYDRASDLKPDFAYAHYYAGLAYQRVKNTGKLSEHFEAFMRLAPDSPERPAVAAVLRTLRPR